MVEDQETESRCQGAIFLMERGEEQRAPGIGLNNEVAKFADDTREERRNGKNPAFLLLSGSFGAELLCRGRARGNHIAAFPAFSCSSHSASFSSFPFVFVWSVKVSNEQCINLA